MCSRADKAVQLIRQEIERLSRSRLPSDEMAVGMIQMAFAQGDITNQQELDLTQDAADTVRRRRAELHASHNQKCIEGAAA
ncbi:hypothetical protein [Pseudomonas nitroreducens]|uniref:hypothetical protein n=1 Tax=Pseudomonas nitroreducens TaxID=46680 RepID=UPI00351CF158